MLLHNQKGAAIEWESGYKWEPYGACEVPDELVPLIKSTGFPVDVTPVPPREKARRAAAAASEAEEVSALEEARTALASAQDTTREAKSAVEASDIRASEARGEAEAAKERVLALEEENRTLRGSVTEIEVLVTEKTREIVKLKEELALLRPQASPKAAPAAKPEKK